VIIQLQLLGNPNVGKSTIFNNLTGLHQHTGNWPGKTVSNASGISKFNNKDFLLVDIPGTYSIMSNSQEEEIARDYICFGNPDCTVIVVDATCLERNLNLVYQILEITNKVVVCVNLLDEAKKKGITIKLDRLSAHLGVPVVGTIARKKKTLFKLMSSVYNICISQNNTFTHPISYNKTIENCISIIQNQLIDSIPNLFNNNYRWLSLKLLENNYKIIDSIETHLNIKLLNNPHINNSIDVANNLLLENGITSNILKNTIVSTILFRSEEITIEVTEYTKNKHTELMVKIDKLLTSKLTGIPIMFLFFAFIFWLTIVGSNYPSKFLSNIFEILENKLLILFNTIHSPNWLTSILISGMYRTLSWIISVMLPPMAIFFPLFTILEDSGYLPRIAFNLDCIFQKANTSRKAGLNNVYGVWV